MATNIETTILEKVIRGLNSLEGTNCDAVDMYARNKEDADELKSYLTNYNVEINNSLVSSGYFLRVSKKEKVKDVLYSEKDSIKKGRRNPNTK
jgi:hypothetical protein